jgi:hypothetical protein
VTARQVCDLVSALLICRGQHREGGCCQLPKAIPFRAVGQGLGMPQVGVLLSAHGIEVLVKSGQGRHGFGVEPATLDQDRHQTEAVIETQCELVYQWIEALGELTRPCHLCSRVQCENSDVTDERGEELRIRLLHEDSVKAQETDLITRASAAAARSAALLI